MKQEPGSNTSNQPSEPIRKSVLGVMLVALLGAGAFAYIRFRPHSETVTESVPVSTSDQETSANSGIKRTTLSPGVAPSPTASTEPVPAPSAEANPAPPPAPKVIALPPALAGGPPGTPYTRDLINSLTKLDVTSGSITPEQSAAWRQSLTNLISRGAESIPAMREFLAQNSDVKFDSVSGADQLGARSTRLAVLQALQTIGGPEAMALSSASLQVSRDPREIALLASALEQQAPEQYREMAANSAREALALAQSDPSKMQGMDVAPLFDVLRQYGGPAAVADFANATDKFKYYSMITLAQLPENAGIPALMDMAQNRGDKTTGGRALAVEILSQDAWKNPQVADLLVEQVKAGGIPLSTLYTISSLLGGERYQLGTESAPDSGEIKHTYHLQYGNQQYSTYAAPMSPDQIRGNIDIIDRYLASTPDASMAEVFRETKTQLQGRLAGAPAPGK